MQQVPTGTETALLEEREKNGLQTRDAYTTRSYGSGFATHGARGTLARPFHDSRVIMHA